MPILRVRMVDAFGPIYKLIRAHRYDEALALLLRPDATKLERRFRSDVNHAWYLVGDIYFKKGRFKDALIAFKKALRTKPDDYQALWAIGNCYSEIEMPAIAERYFRRALTYKPAEKGLIYNLGNALLDQGKFSEALRSFNEVCEKDKTLYRLAQKNATVAKKALEKKTNKMKDKLEGKPGR